MNQQGASKQENFLTKQTFKRLLTLRSEYIKTKYRNRG